MKKRRQVIAWSLIIAGGCLGLGAPSEKLALVVSVGLTIAVVVALILLVKSR